MNHLIPGGRPVWKALDFYSWINPSIEIIKAAQLVIGGPRFKHFLEPEG
jgi:hypothetical protein